MSTLAFVTAAMQALVPAVDHTELADAIARRVDAEAPLFKADADRRMTAAFLVAVAYRESSLKLDAIGDHGRARCAFQLWAAPAEVLTDADLCVRIGFERLRESVKVCGAKNLLGLYASGPNGCVSDKARRISNDRLAIAKRLVAAIPVEDEPS